MPASRMYHLTSLSTSVSGLLQLSIKITYIIRPQVKSGSADVAIGNAVIEL